MKDREAWAESLTQYQTIIFIRKQHLLCHRHGYPKNLAVREMANYKLPNFVSNCLNRFRKHLKSFKYFVFAVCKPIG